MGYKQARELARIRQELRDRLLSHRPEGADQVLARFRHAVDVHAMLAPELRGEYERWKLRFELLEAPV